MSDELKLEEEDKNILVTNFEDSLKAHENIKSGDAAKWKKDFEQRKDEWIKMLRADIVLGESMNIVDDIVKTLHPNKKLVISK
jgi:carboxyl-terminal processing protease